MALDSTNLLYQHQQVLFHVESPVVININLTIATTLPPEPFLNLAQEDGTIDIISTTSQHSASLLFVKYWAMIWGALPLSSDS